jgi:hypothetical protein
MIRRTFVSIVWKVFWKVFFIERKKDCDRLTSSSPKRHLYFFNSFSWSSSSSRLPLI